MKRTESPDSFEQSWRRRFARFAQAHNDDAGIAGWTPTGLQARLRRFSGLWSPSSGRWLDAGCGAGSYTRLLREAGLDVVGLDYSEPTLRKAKERVPDSKLWCVGDVRQLPFPEKYFQGAVCFGVTQALTESEGLVRELTRILMRDGKIWLDGLNSWCFIHYFGRLIGYLSGARMHLRYESPFRLQRILRESGYRNVKIHWLPIAPGRCIRTQTILESGFLKLLFERVPFLGALLSHSMILTGELAPQGPNEI